MLVHCQLLFTTVLYFSVFIISIVDFATLLAAKEAVKGCYLYVTYKGHGIVDSRSELACNFNVYAAIVATAYALIMTIYHGYATVVALRENHIGRTMWVMPWLLLNSLASLTMFICSIIYTLGFYFTCHRASEALSYDGKSCKKNLENVNWGKDSAFKDSTFTSMSTAEITSWIGVLFWCGLFALEMIRMFRNRRARAKDNYVDPTTSDVVNITDMQPTA